MIEFRKATADDIAILTTFRQKALREDGVVSEIDITKNVFNYFLAAIKENSFIAWVAIVEDRIIATAGMCFYKKPPYFQNVSGALGEVCNVYTEKEFRRKGIAKKLLRHLVDEAKSRNVSVLRVSASKMGEHLYKAFGFKKAENFYTLQI